MMTCLLGIVVRHLLWIVRQFFVEQYRSRLCIVSSVIALQGSIGNESCLR